MANIRRFPVLLVILLVASSCDIFIKGADTATNDCIYYADLDGDGYGNHESSVTPTECTAPSGYVVDSTDCDDTDPTTHPGAEDLCDGVDNNCKGDLMAGEADADGDGFASCPPNEYIPAGDCDDHDSTVYPGATEVCNEHDDDCNGLVDDFAIDAPTWYADNDGDGFGFLSITHIRDCIQPNGYVADDTDCDDTNADVNPDAIDVNDGIDNDCDGEIDED